MLCHFARVHNIQITNRKESNEIWTDLSRKDASGFTPTYISLSKRPGHRNAGSMKSGMLLAPIINISWKMPTEKRKWSDIKIHKYTIVTGSQITQGTSVETCKASISASTWKKYTRDDKEHIQNTIWCLTLHNILQQIGKATNQKGRNSYLSEHFIHLTSQTIRISRGIPITTTTSKKIKIIKENNTGAQWPSLQEVKQMLAYNWNKRKTIK